MRGVFGAGVAQAFQERGLYPRIEAIYGASAGIMTGAYFLSRQTMLGASIYWEDLGEKFISKKNFFIGVWQRFQNRFLRKVPTELMKDALDINFLMKIVTREKSLDTQGLISQNIPLFVKLFNLDTHSLEYIDARRPNVLEILKAGINVFPYVHEVSHLDGHRYIDAAIMEILGLETLRQRHPNSLIILVMNGQIDRKLRYKLKNMLEGKFMEWMFRDSKLYPLYAYAENRLQEDLEKIKSDKNIYLITDNKSRGVRSRTTNKRLLKETFEFGREAGKQALNNLNI